MALVEVRNDLAAVATLPAVVEREVRIQELRFLLRLATRTRLLQVLAEQDYLRRTETLVEIPHLTRQALWQKAARGATLELVLAARTGQVGRVHRVARVL
ncbi:MAG: hypothetical protein WCT12_22335 [Verrucomicrobiota bacterium]